MTDPTPIPPGWYADPDGGPYSRWWDGSQWASHEPVPTASSALMMPNGVDAGTVWIWLVALFPLLGLGVLLYDFQNIFDLMTQLPTATTFSPFEIFTPGYFAATLLPLAGTAGTIVFSALDFRALRARGVVQPFHWAWSFFVLLVQSYGAVIYPIGRTIVARRRGARASWVAMIVAIVVQLIVLVATALWSFQLMSQMLSVISTLPTVR